MKVINIIIRTFSILAILAALTLFIFFGKSEGELIGSTVSVVLSGILIFLVTYLPSMLKKRKIIMSKTLYSIILLAMVLSMGGGFIFRFYWIFNYYDSIIHFLNGINLALIVFVVLYYIAEEPIKFTPPLIAVSILVAIALGALWEIYEYIFDLVVPTGNMQRFKDVNTGIEFIGQEALKDTMVDLIVDSLGAVIAGLVLYIDSIRGKKIINNLILKKEDETK